MTVSRFVQMVLEVEGAFFCSICFLYVLAGHKIDSRRCLLLIGLLSTEAIQLLSDAIAIGFRGNPSNLGWFAVRISNYIVFVANFVLAIFCILYIEQLLKGRDVKVDRIWRWLEIGVSIIGIGTITISQFTHYLYSFDESNTYYRGKGFIVISILAAIAIILVTIMTLYYRKKLRKIESIPMVCMTIVPLVADAVQVFFYGISLANIAIMVSVCFLFGAYEIERSQRLVEQERELIEHRAEIAEKRTQIMLSQIQPHFLFNTLGSIETLCAINPEMAEKAVHHFSRYLRMNINSLKDNQLIPFEKEMEYTREYLWIEKMRFQEKLNVEYNLDAVHFSLPSLTVQPMVENAVRHGVCQKVQGGTVKISSKEEGEYIVITIEDDGVGFSMDVFRDGKIHVGVENVKERLQLLCNGTLDLQSEPGKGVLCTIKIPIEFKGDLV